MTQKNMAFYSQSYMILTTLKLCTAPLHKNMNTTKQGHTMVVVVVVVVVIMMMMMSTNTHTHTYIHSVDPQFVKRTIRFGISINTQNIQSTLMIGTQLTYLDISWKMLQLT